MNDERKSGRGEEETVSQQQDMMETTPATESREGCS